MLTAPFAEEGNLHTISDLTVDKEEGFLLGRLSTSEFEHYIHELHEKLRIPASRDGIFRELDVYFGPSRPQNSEGAFAFTDEFGYHYAFSEKGKVRIHKVSDDIFDASYWILSDQVFNMALEYAKYHQIPGRDFRRVLFAKELELFKSLGPNYVKRAEIAIDEILKREPYRD